MIDPTNDDCLRKPSWGLQANPIGTAIKTARGTPPSQATVAWHSELFSTTASPEAIIPPIVMESKRGGVPRRNLANLKFIGG